MRNLFLSGIIGVVCILVSSVYAEEITLTTYYPAPYGEYRVLQLAPISTTARPTCNEGETGRMYYDSGLDAVSPGEGLYYCDGTSWQDVGGVWTQSGSNIYYTGGNVGIGIADPVNRLDVNGAMAVGAAYAGANTAPANGMIIEGDVGIGTDTVTADLDIRAANPVATVRTTPDMIDGDMARLTISASSVIDGSVGIEAFNDNRGSRIPLSIFASPLFIPGSVGIGDRVPVVKAPLDVETDGGLAIFARSHADYGTGLSVVGGSGNSGRAILASGHTGVLRTSVTHAGRGIHGLWTQSGGATNRGYGVFGEAQDVNSYDFYAGGVGINYAPFTGAHEVKLSDDFPGEGKRGMVVSVNGEAQNRDCGDGSISISSTLPSVKLSRIRNDRAVFGAFVGEGPLPPEHWYKVKEGERFGTVNAVGEGRVLVTNINSDIQAGDYITTSVIPGYGQKQDDDILHSYTLGKAIENVNWDEIDETLSYDGKEYKIYLIAVVYTSG